MDKTDWDAIYDKLGLLKDQIQKAHSQMKKKD